jgi:hypothetical protein
MHTLPHDGSFGDRGSFGDSARNALATEGPLAPSQRMAADNDKFRSTAMSLFQSVGIKGSEHLKAVFQIKGSIKGSESLKAVIRSRGPIKGAESLKTTIKGSDQGVDQGGRVLESCYQELCPLDRVLTEAERGFTAVAGIAQSQTAGVASAKGSDVRLHGGSRTLTPRTLTRTFKDSDPMNGLFAPGAKAV